MESDTNEQNDQRRWFCERVLPLEPRLHCAARRLGATTGLDPEDLVQDVLLKMMNYDDYRDVLHPLAFLQRMMGNLALDALRRAKVVPVEAFADMAAFEIADDTPGQDRILTSRQEYHRLLQIVDGLPEQCRAAFRLRRLQGYSVARVAESLGISVSTTETHLAKGLRLCTERLAREQEQDDDGRSRSRTHQSRGGGVGRPSFGWPRRR